MLQFLPLEMEYILKVTLANKIWFEGTMWQFLLQETILSVYAPVSYKNMPCPQVVAGPKRLKKRVEQTWTQVQHRAKPSQSIA